MINSPRPKKSSATLPPIKISKWQENYNRGNTDQCEQMARQWVRMYPKDRKSWQLLGVSLLYRGMVDAAIQALSKACQIKGGDWSIWENLAVALQRSGRHIEAEIAFQRSLRLAPDQASIWTNASTNQLQLGRAQEAFRLARRAVELAPNLAESNLNLGNALSQLGQSDEALAAFENALRLRPNFTQTLLSLGLEYSNRGDLTEACAITRRALAISPMFEGGHLNMGRLLNQLGDFAAAGKHFRTARQINPTMITAWSGSLYCALHDYQLSTEQVLSEHIAFKQYIDESSIYNCDTRPYDNVPIANRRLRLGFVSGDMKNHPVARFIEPIWRYLDRSKFEIIAYDNCSADDDIARVLKSLADHWEVISAMPDKSTAEKIRTDHIDILFDLSGHTAYNRLGVFALKPSPIQISWLGYPATTGLSAMDYRLVDAVSAPLGISDGQFIEKLAYLPQTTILSKPPELPALAEPPIHNKGHITFGSFQRLNKLNDDVIATWSEILKRIPASRLMIGGVPCNQAESFLYQRFKCHGISEERLMIRRRIGMADYLAMHNEVDILLDTWPFSSGTTSNLALWMGVPTITLVGPNMAQRLCAARLVPLGLGEFIAETKDQYVDLAVKWSRKPNELAELKTRLRDVLEANTESDVEKLTRALENRLQEMWERWSNSLPPITLK